MSRRATWALRAAVGLHGASLLLDPLVLFRACAAGLDSELGYMLAVLAPASAALGAAVLGPWPKDGGEPELGRRASLWSMAAVTARILGALLLAWLAQSTGSKEPLPIWLGPALGLAWAAAFAFTGSAIALGVRIGRDTIGRIGFAEAAGGAAIALTVPLWMALGAPRTLIAAAALPTLAAFAFASLASRNAEAPRARRAPIGSVLVTFPLVLVTLVAGDIGEPWLRIPAQTARRATGGTLMWTAEGLIAAPKPSNRQLGYWVDDSALIALASLRTDAPKLPATVGDFVFTLADPTHGPALVIGSGGGSEPSAALLAGHRPVHAIELHPTVVRDLALGALGDQTGYFFSAAESLDVYVGDGRAGLPTVDGGYSRIVVVGAEPFVAAAPRLLTWTARAYTREAIVTLLGRLAPQGVLSMVRPVAQLPALVATARTALGMTPEDARRHMLACTAQNAALLLVRQEPWSAAERQRVTTGCRKRRMVVHDVGDALGLTEPRAPRERDEGEPDEEASPVGGVPIVATDDRPFFGPLLPFGELPSVVLRDLARAFVMPEPGEPTAGEAVGAAASAASATVPTASTAAAKRGKPAPRKPATSPPPPSASPEVAAVRGIGILWATALFAALMVGAALATGRRRGRPASDAASRTRARRFARARWALLPLGAALGWSELGTVELAVRLLGHPVYGWTVAIPTSLAAIASGRLLFDAVSPSRLRRSSEVVLSASVLVLAVLFAAGFRTSALLELPGWLASLLAIVALLAQGGTLGAAFCALMRPLGAAPDGDCTSCGGGLASAWAVHSGGWALGAASGAIVVRHVGTQALLMLAAAAVLSAAVLAGRARLARA